MKSFFVSCEASFNQSNIIFPLLKVIKKYSVNFNVLCFLGNLKRIMARY